MRTLAIITGRCIFSARQLAEGMNKRTNGEWQAKVYDVRKDIAPVTDWLFSYGCSQKLIGRKQRINASQAVIRCVDKVTAFRMMQASKIPIPGYVERKKDVPDTWERIVVRSKVDGRKAEDLDYFFQEDKLPDAPLYTEYFEHKYEYRIVVFMGKVVGRYYKAETGFMPNGQLEWTFKPQPKRGFEKMDEACLKAAKALGIDFVGFDVVAMNKNDFVILEANSGPILTGEAEEAIINYYLNLPE